MYLSSCVGSHLASSDWFMKCSRIWKNQYSWSYCNNCSMHETLRNRVEWVSMHSSLFSATKLRDFHAAQLLSISDWNAAESEQPIRRYCYYTGDQVKHEAQGKAHSIRTQRRTHPEVEKLASLLYLACCIDYLPAMKIIMHRGSEMGGEGKHIYVWRLVWSHRMGRRKAAY